MKPLSNHSLHLTPLLWLGATLTSQAVLVMPDAPNRMYDWNPGVQVATPAQVLAEVGAVVDDTYTGTLNFTVTMLYNSLQNGNGSDAYAAFHLWNGGTEKLGIGDGWGETKWGCFNVNGGNDFTAGGGPFPLTAGTPEAISFRIDYVAGGNDTVTIKFRGHDNVRTGDFSFDRIQARAGNNNVSFSGMTLSAGDGDTDDDGMPDAWEAIYGLNTNLNDAGLDNLDNDNLTNLEEYQNNSIPNNPDTDGDTLLDGPEVKVYGSLPNNKDSDGDQLADNIEVAGGTLPNNADTDADGHSDSQEIAAGTNPNLISSVPTRYYQNFGSFANGEKIFVDGSKLDSNNGIASVQNGALRLTQAGNNTAASVLRLPPLAGSSAGWVASFDVRIRNNRSSGEPADGLAFTYGNLPPTGLAPTAEEGWPGTNNHISYEIDTFDDVGGNERGVNIAQQADGNTQSDLVGGFTNGRILNPSTEVAGHVICTWRPDPGNPGQSLVSFTTTGLMTNAAFAELSSLLDGADAHTFAIAARTGGLSESVWIDNLSIVAGADSDTDDDNLPDAWEYGQIGNLTEIASSNTDGDNFDNAAELANGTSPATSDSDGDALSDSDEVNVYYTHPNVADPDLDTILDGEEVVAGTDGYVTNANLADTDGDGFSDEAEIAEGGDPTNPANFPTPTLLLYYPFDTQNGSVVANGASGVPAGTIVGGGSYTAGQSAAFGTAFLANRTGANTARVETGLTATQLGLLTKYTVMAWVRWDGSSGGDDQMIFGQVGGTPQLHHGLRVNGGGINDVHFGHWGNDVSDSGSVTQGTWVHLAWSWDGQQGRTFVNGVQATNNDNDIEGPLEPSAVSRIVAIAYSELGGSFNGAVDEAKVFDLDMTAAQILAASAAPPPAEFRISEVSYDAANSRMLIRVVGIPTGTNFHLKTSTTLQDWAPLSPTVNFTSVTAQPLVVPVNVNTDPKRFFRVEDGVSPSP